ncbi:MAG: hypothetical protein RI949_2161 [Pseudomonadota bacterium]
MVKSARQAVAAGQGVDAPVVDARAVAVTAAETPVAVAVMVVAEDPAAEAVDVKAALDRVAATAPPKDRVNGASVASGNGAHWRSVLHEHPP